MSRDWWEWCMTCKQHLPAVSLTGVVVCAHVHQGQPCTDRSVNGVYDYTREAIGEDARDEGLTVEEWQQRNLERLEL